MKLRCIVAALAICGSLTACGGDVTFETTVTHTDGPGQNDTTTIGGKMVWKPNGRVHGFRSTALDVSNIAIDIAGQGTAVLDSSGTGTLLLTDGDTVIGLTTFDYVVMDSMAVIADPSTLNEWLTHYPSADGYNVELHDIETVDTGEGVATLTVDTRYGSNVISTASTSWASSAGNGCENPGGGDGGVAEMPIELPGEGGCP